MCTLSRPLTLTHDLTNSPPNSASGTPSLVGRNSVSRRGPRPAAFTPVTHLSCVSHTVSFHHTSTPTLPHAPAQCHPVTPNRMASPAATHTYLSISHAQSTQPPGVTHDFTVVLWLSHISPAHRATHNLWLQPQSGAHSHSLSLSPTISLRHPRTLGCLSCIQQKPAGAHTLLSVSS